MQDCIPISREIFENWIYADAEYFKVWVTMLAKARYAAEPKHSIYQNIQYTQNRGEFIFGRPTWCKDTGISDKRLRRLIELLIKDGMIELVKKYNKFTIYKIVNYEKFNPKKGQQNDQQPGQEIQGVEETEGQQEGWQKSNEGPTEGWQRANTEESKEREEGKESNTNTPIATLTGDRGAKADYQGVLDEYNATCVKMPKAEALNKTRRGLINGRIKEYGRGAITEVFRYASQSPHHNGSNDRGWKADFTWLMGPDNFVKMLERARSGTISVKKKATGPARFKEFLEGLENDNTGNNGDIDIDCEHISETG